MKQLLAIILILLVFFYPARLLAQNATAQTSAITEAILDLTTTPRRNLAWYVCNKRLDTQEKIAHASRLATLIVTNASNDLNPWWMTAQLMQESGLNCCAISSYEFKSYQKILKRPPTKRDLLKLLGSRALRERAGIFNLDGGIAQFRWPGRIAKLAGITSAKQLFDPELSIKAFAKALRYYKSKAPETYTGIYYTSSGRKIKYKKAGSKFYWTSYNTGDPRRFNYKYYSSVKNRYKRIEKRNKKKRPSTNKIFKN
jgi:hypothetical protein